MRTIQMTHRANAKLDAYADELGRIYRGVGVLVATPGTVLEYVGWGHEKDCDFIRLTPGGPYVGQPATVCVGTDRHPATVIAVSATGTKVTVRQDRAIRTDDNGMSDSQSYAFEPDEQGEVRVFYRGQFGYRSRGYYLRLGVRSAFYDYTV